MLVYYLIFCIWFWIYVCVYGATVCLVCFVGLVCMLCLVGFGLKVMIA